MSTYPQTSHFSGLNLPIRMEVSIRNLEVEGEIPKSIEGAFFRAVPDPAHPPKFADDIILSGDGMIARFLFQNGSVDYDIKYVKTQRYLAEHAARKALFGHYRNPFTDDPSVQDVDRTVANTTPIWHAGRLFMAKEDGRPYEIDPHSLDTIGRWDFEGQLRSNTVTAHPRVDETTGEMFFYGYEAGGECENNVAYCIADADGKLISEQWFEQPYPSTIHDFAITEKWAIFPVFPTTTDIERLRAGGPKWAHQQDLESWIGILPRYGSVDQIQWIEGPKGVSAFHIINAFDDGDLIHMDLCLSDTNAFAFMREAGGLNIAQQDINGGVTRWTLDTGSNKPKLVSRPLAPPGDMPRLRNVDQGRRYGSAWYCSLDPSVGPPLVGGPVGVASNMLLRFEPDSGSIDALSMGPGWGLNEPVHIGDSYAPDEEWLIFVADKKISESSHESEIWIVAANDLAAGPVAKIKVPVQLRSQVHGTWIPMSELKASKR